MRSNLKEKSQADKDSMIDRDILNKTTDYRWFTATYYMPLQPEHHVLFSSNLFNFTVFLCGWLSGLCL